MISEEDKKRIASAIRSKIPDLTCPMCRNKRFVMSDGYFVTGLQPDISSYKLGGAGVPAIGIICSNCGFISQHALGALNLLPEEKITKDESPK